MLFGIILNLLISNIVVAQSGKIFYNVELKESIYEKVKDKSSISADIILNASKLINDIVFAMTFDNEEANFEQIESLPTKDADQLYHNMATKLVNNALYYYNLSSKKIIYQKEFLGDSFIINSSLDDYEWEILLDQTLIINGYNCQKAICKINTIDGEFITEAWFTPEIPLSFGPVGYCGLPGLILELNVRNLIYKFESIDLDSVNVGDIVIPENGIKLTQEEFDHYVLEKGKMFLSRKL